MGMTIQAVFFDMGGTIETYRYTPELRLDATPGLQQRLASAGIDLPLTNEQLYTAITEGLKRYHAWRMASLDELPPGRVWRDFILPAYAPDPAALEAVAEALTLYIETRYYERQMRPEMPQVLEAIRTLGLRIGLISNVTSRGQVPYNLEKYGIQEYFDPVVLSSEYGRRKPDPAIFHYAARMANVPASQCLYVGDRISRDIVGARRAGYGLAVQIRHDFKHGEKDDGAVPDAVIGNMLELLDILRIRPTRAAGQPRPLHQVRALLFDAGDILYYRPRRGRKLNAFLKELNIELDDHHLVEKKLLDQRAYRGQITPDQYREALLRIYQVTDPEQVERGKRVLIDEDNDVCFFEGVRNTLAALKEQGYLLGIVTDTASPLYVKINWVERGEIGHFWDSIISSQELGVRKPDAKMYQAALQQLGLQAQEAVFVGHKPSELEGARAVGLKTVAFNYEPGAQADCYIEKFADLLAVPVIA